MRRLFLLLMLVFWSGVSSASTLITWRGTYTAGHSSAEEACISNYPYAYNPQSMNLIMSPPGADQMSCNFYYNGENHYYGNARKTTSDCPFGDNGSSCNASCDAPNSMVDGQCVAPPPDPCFSLYGQTKGFSVSGNSNDPGAFYQPIPGSKFWANPNSVILGGCSATVEPGVKCKVYGDGAFTCVGTGKYQGVTADPSEGLPPSDPCAGESCPDTDPTPISNGSSACTDWVIDGEGRRTKTCETTSNAKQPGQAACLTDGSLVCVAASPTPQSDSKIRNDDIKETPLASGGTQTDTTSTTTNTYCSAGACTTTNTTNTTTSVTNGAGDTVSQTGTCEGDECAEPQTEEEAAGELPKQSELPAVGEEGDPDYSEALSNFTGRVQSSPLISAVGNIAFPSGGGSCSMGSASLWGGSISFNSFCTMAPDVLGGLRFLFLSIWAVAAVRLFMTA